MLTKRTPFQNDSETQLSVGGVSVKTQRMRAESPMTSTAKGNDLGEKGILNLTPVRATLSGSIELPLQGAMFIECYVPRVPPWVKVSQKPMRPVRAKALIINAFALTGRLDYIYPYTQGGAQGYVLLPLRGVLLRLLARHPPTFVAFNPYN